MTDTIIDQGPGFVIVQTDESLTSVPYRPEDHEDGNRNHGFVDLRDNLALISEINEASGRPGMIAILEAINAVGSPLMSLGCERGFFTRDTFAPGEPTCYYGSYVGIAYRDSAANISPQTFIRLARSVVREVSGAEPHLFFFEMLVEPLRYFFGDVGRYSLTIKIQGYGADASVAEDAWEYAAGEVARSIRVFMQA